MWKQAHLGGGNGGGWEGWKGLLSLRRTTYFVHAFTQASCTLGNHAGIQSVTLEMSLAQRSKLTCLRAARLFLTELFSAP